MSISAVVFHDDVEVVGVEPAGGEPQAVEVIVPVPPCFNHHVGVGQQFCKPVAVRDNLQVPALVDVLLPVGMVESDHPAEAIRHLQVATHGLPSAE